MKPAMMFSSVLLPHPLGPTIETNSPLNRRVDLADRPDLSRLRQVHLSNTIDFDHCALLGFVNECPVDGQNRDRAIARGGGLLTARLADVAHVHGLLIRHALQFFVAELAAVTHDPYQPVISCLIKDI